MKPRWKPNLIDSKVKKQLIVVKKLKVDGKNVIASKPKKNIYRGLQTSSWSL